ncbi:hypothetical protein D3C86_933650 [compost metagenome]
MQTLQQRVDLFLARQRKLDDLGIQGLETGVIVRFKGSRGHEDVYGRRSPFSALSILKMMGNL